MVSSPITSNLDPQIMQHPCVYQDVNERAGRLLSLPQALPYHIISLSVADLSFFFFSVLLRHGSCFLLTSVDLLSQSCPSSADADADSRGQSQISAPQPSLEKFELRPVKSASSFSLSLSLVGWEFFCSTSNDTLPSVCVLFFCFCFISLSACIIAQLAHTILIYAKSHF